MLKTKFTSSSKGQIPDHEKAEKNHEKAEKNHKKEENVKEAPKDDRSGLYGSGDSLRSPSLVLFYTNSGPSSSNPSLPSTTKQPQTQTSGSSQPVNASGKKGQQPTTTTTSTTTTTTTTQTNGTVQPPQSATASPSAETTPNATTGMLISDQNINSSPLPDPIHQKSPTYSTRPTLTTPTTSLSKFGLNTINDDLTGSRATDALRNNGVILFYNPSSSKATSSSVAPTSTSTSSSQVALNSIVSKSTKKKDKTHSKKNKRKFLENPVVQLVQLGESQYNNRDFFASFQPIGTVKREGFGMIFEATEKSYMFHPPTFAMKAHALNAPFEEFSKGDELDFYLAELSHYTSLSHKNLVSVYDLYVRTDTIYMVLEYCELGSLSEISSELMTPFSEMQVAFICHEVLQGLKFLHAIGIIHRDIKASNILVNQAGEIKIGDFGCCDSINPEFRKYNFVGTPHWMAPELIASLETLIPYDERIDIWSLGITIIELIENDVPHSDIHHSKVLSVIVNEPAPSLNHQSKQNFSPGFSKFIRTCLTKDPRLRPFASQLLEHSLFKEIDFCALSEFGLVHNDSISQLETFFSERDLYKEGSDSSGPLLEDATTTPTAGSDSSAGTNVISSTFSFKRKESKKINLNLIEAKKTLRKEELIQLVTDASWKSDCELFDTLQRKLSPDKIIPLNKVLFGEKIGTKSTASVYHGSLKTGNKNQDCTIKIFHLPRIFQNDKDTITKFNHEVLREFHILTSLKHPNTVNFVGATIQPLLCVVMDYCSQGSLYNRLTDSRFNFSWFHFFSVVLNLVDGLSYLHNNNPPIFHRDLNPSNILIDSNDIVKIADFGTAVYASDDPLELQKPKGAYTHMAPEVFCCQTYSEKSDIFSFGVVLWEMAYKCLIKEYQKPYSEYVDLKFEFPILTKINQGLRPIIPSNCPVSLKLLINAVWTHHPFQRPTLSVLGQFANVAILNIPEFENYKIVDRSIHKLLISILDNYEKASMYNLYQDNPIKAKSVSSGYDFYGLESEDASVAASQSYRSKEYRWSNSSGTLDLNHQFKSNKWGDL